MNRLLEIVIGLVVAASLAPAAHVRADGSTVGGTLTGDTHWTLAGSPYVFSANVILATGATLTIDPGVTVLANAHALYLQGKVTAVGTPTDPIVMDHAVEIVFYPGAEGSAFAWTEFRSMFDYVRPDQNTYGPLPSLAHVWFNGGRGLYFYYPHAGTVTDTYTFSDARFTGGAEVGGCCSSWSGSRLSIEGGGVITAYSNSIGITISDSNILPKAGSWEARPASVAPSAPLPARCPLPRRTTGGARPTGPRSTRPSTTASTSLASPSSASTRSERGRSISMDRRRRSTPPSTRPAAH